MTGVLAFCAAVAVPSTEADAPSFVHLLPAGQIRGRDGRSWSLTDPKAVIAASLRSGIDLPIDYEHQADDPARQKNGPVPAAGWIKALEARPDGIWGKVEWTATAAELIASKAYRYLSPVMRYDPRTGTVLRLTGAGLVHHPNLELTALASEEAPMSDATPDLGRIAEALGLADASLEAILAAITATREPDPAQYVPVAAVRELLADRNGKIALMSEREATLRVEEAMASGHITPGMRDWATALCRQNPESFDEFLKAPAAWAHLFRPAVRGKPPSGRDGAGSAEEKAICAQLGLDPSRLT